MKNYIYIQLFMLLHINFCYAQIDSDIFNIEDYIDLDSEKPRNGIFADSTGSYDLLLKVSHFQINPGEKILITVYIAGYGKIDIMKINHALPTNIFDSKRSFVIGGSGKVENDIFLFNSLGEFLPISTVTRTTLAGIRTKKWNQSTLVIDMKDTENENEKDIPLLFSEFTPVLKYELETLKNARAGQYNAEFIFTYFNGANWETKKTILFFSVRNYYDRFEFWVWLVGIIIAFFTILTNIRSLE